MTADARRPEPSSKGPSRGSAEGAGGARLRDRYPDKVHTWPYLVRLEMLVATAVMVGLTVWSIVVDAPLEEAANPTKTPNPSKAPWYFLGLQELLVYFDPWFAGVVLPSLIIVGLMVIPYVDVNPKGNGYYTFRERKFAVSVFLFGFLVMWIALVVMGTFLRGPGWNFFWPWQYWDAHKTVAITNRNLSEVVGLGATGPLPIAFGVTLLVLWLVVLPAVYWRRSREKSATLQRLGRVRYWITASLLMIMAGTVVKVALRLLLNVKYVLQSPWINV